MTHALEVTDLKKKYTNSGPWIINDLSFHVPQGSICGLIGPNGAGKTTLYSLISGFLPPDAGSINILSSGSFDPWKFRGRMGVLPQDAEIDGRFTCIEFLHYMASLQGLSIKEAKIAAEEALQDVNLMDRAAHRISTLSHGMLRRIATASALLGKPELVLLDEPTAGLDPVQASSLRKLISSWRGRGTLMISSHNLFELEKICDWIVVLEKGSLVIQGPIDSIIQAHTHVVWKVSPSANDPAVLLSAKLLDHKFQYEPEENTIIQLAPNIDCLDASAIIIAQTLSENGIAIRSCIRGKTLEESIIQTSV